MQTEPATRSTRGESLSSQPSSSPSRRRRWKRPPTGSGSIRPRSGGGAPRPCARCRRHHSRLDLARPVLHGGHRVRVHAVFRRQRRARRLAGDADRLGNRRVTATLLAIHALDNPYRPGVGSLKPVAMERTLDILAEARGLVNDRLRFRATRKEQHADAPHRGPRDSAPRRRGGRNRLQRLPGNALERRAGEGLGHHQQDQDRRGPRPGALPGANAGRRRDVHPVGGRLRARGHGARGLLLQALPRGVQAGRPGVARDEAAQEPRCAADPVRDARVQTRRAPKRNDWTRRPSSRPRRCGATSSGRRTTSSVSSSSPSRSSSRG